MLCTNDKLKSSLTSGLAKGWDGFIWMLKILLPISILTSLIAWLGWINKLDVILEPAMQLIGLPSMAVLPLIAGLLTGPYGAIAAMASLPLTAEEMTLIAIFLLISHSLIQEGVIQNQSGLSFLKATLFRLIASIATTMVVSWFMVSESTAGNPVNVPSMIQQAPFVRMLKAWAIDTTILSGKILIIIVALMILLEIMRNFNLIDRIVFVMAPVLKVLGLGKQTGFVWLTAATFGLTYGAAIVVQEAKEGYLSPDELEHLQISIGINHSMIEDPALFLSLGPGLFWLYVPRLVAAIAAVHLFILVKRLMPGQNPCSGE